MHPTAVSRFPEAASVAVGARRIDVLPTPGHAAGHLAFVIEGPPRIVFTGDLVFSRGRVAVLATPDSDIQQLRWSIGRLADSTPDVLLPGHGSLVLKRAGEHLAIAVGCFADGALPPPLVH
jgi:glyoxylase-like metal-dependent hydrolase (beta-lactamase superfamily II)